MLLGKKSKMPRGTKLSEEEQIQVLSFRESGWTIRQIGARLNRGKNVIQKFVTNPSDYVTIKRLGRKPLLSKRDKREIKRLAVIKKTSPAQIRHKLNLPVSTRRVQQILKESENIQYDKRLAKPKLLQRHKIGRLKFAEKYKFWDSEWQLVLFSDEKKFNLGGPDGCQKYWRDTRQDREYRHRRNLQGGSLMVWAAFGHRGKSPICFISNKMTSNEYVELLDNVLVNFGDELYGNEWKFQQDNAPIHNAKHTKNFFSSSNIPVIEWPAISPDLNPIENLWSILSQKVYAAGRQFDSILELKVAIQTEWNNIDSATLCNLTNSMPYRLSEVIRLKGDHINY